MQGRRDTGQQRGEPCLALDEWSLADVVAVEMQKIEDEIHQPGHVAGIRGGLDHAEGGYAVGEHAAQLAVEIGVARDERRHGRGDRRIFMGPVESGAGEHPDTAAIEARMHAVAVEFDFVQPLVAFRRSMPAERAAAVRSGRAAVRAVTAAGNGYPVGAVEPPEPVRPRIIVNDTTPEKLGELAPKCAVILWWRGLLGYKRPYYRVPRPLEQRGTQ